MFELDEVLVNKKHFSTKDFSRAITFKSLLKKKKKLIFFLTIFHSIIKQLYTLVSI